jgi:hypothetical protein
MLEEARVGAVEKMIENFGHRFRNELLGRGMSDDEIDAILFEAITEYVLCSVAAIKQQAEDQDLPVDTVLAAVGGTVSGEEDISVAGQLDTAALRLKTSPCSQTLEKSLGIELN